MACLPRLVVRHHELARPGPVDAVGLALEADLAPVLEGRPSPPDPHRPPRSRIRARPPAARGRPPRRESAPGRGAGRPGPSATTAAFHQSLSLGDGEAHLGHLEQPRQRTGSAGQALQEVFLEDGVHEGAVLGRFHLPDVLGEACVWRPPTRGRRGTDAGTWHRPRAGVADIGASATRGETRPAPTLPSNRVKSSPMRSRRRDDPAQAAGERANGESVGSSPCATQRAMSWSRARATDTGGSAEEMPAVKESTDRHRVVTPVREVIQRDGIWARPVRGSTRW